MRLRTAHIRDTIHLHAEQMTQLADILCMGFRIFHQQDPQPGKAACAVLDTWEGEPAFRPDVLAKADIATPHIAGHSFEGRVMGTVMVYREACRFLGREATWSPDALLPPPLVPEITLDAAGLSEEQALWQIVRQVYDIEADDRRMRESAAMDEAARGAYFDRMRKEYPMRREFRFTTVHLKNATAMLAQTVAGLGFRS